MLSSGEADGRTDWEGVCVAKAVRFTLAAVVGAVGAAASSVPRPMKKAATATISTPKTAATTARMRAHEFLGLGPPGGGWPASGAAGGAPGGVVGGN